MVELYSWPGGEVRQKFRGPFPQELSAVALSTHADWIAGGDLVGRITVWRGDGNLKPVLEFRGHTEGIRALKFSDDGRHLASTSEDGSLRLWDCVTGAAVVASPYDGGVVSFAPDGLRMGVGQAGGKLSVLHLEPSPVLHRFRPLRPPESPQMVAFHPDGRSLFCLADGGVARYSVPDGTRLNFFTAHAARSFLPEPGGQDGLVVGGPFGLIRFSLTDPTKSSVLFEKADFGWGGGSASADGRWLAANDTTGRVAVWPAGDTDTARVKFFRDTPMLREETVLSPDGTFVATHGFYDPGLIIFDVNKGTVSRRLPLPPRHATAWSPDGRWFAGMGSTFTLWDTATWETAALPALEPSLFPSAAVTFSWPTAGGPSRYLATVTGTSRVALIEMATRTIAATLEAPQPRAIYKLSFSRDGRWLAAALAGGEIQLWDLPIIQSRLQSSGFAFGRE
jgi:WD40 repeat protein